MARRAAANDVEIKTDLKSLQENSGFPGRQVFRLKSEKSKKSKQLIVGSAQKQEVKGITGLWLQYFNEKEINGVMYNAVEQLLHLIELPENPFIFLSNNLRISELFYGVVHGKEFEFEFQTVEEEDPATKVTCIQGHRGIWGVRNVLQMLDPIALSQLLSRINHYPCLMHRGHSKKGEYSIQFADALTGSSIFHGMLQPYIPLWIQVNQEYLVTGPKFEKAVASFASHIMEEVFNLQSNPGVLVVGVQIEKITYGSPKSGPRIVGDGFKLWTVSKMKTSKASFTSAVKAAAVSNRVVYLELIAELPHVDHVERERRKYRGRVRRRGQHGENWNEANNGTEEAQYEEEDDEFDDNNNDDDDSEDDEFWYRFKREEEPGRVAQFKKFYSLHFQQTDKEGKKTMPQRSFCLFPFSSLCLGVFQDKADADFYANLFKTENDECWTMEDQDKYESFRVYLKSKLIKAYIAGNLVEAVEFLTCLLAIGGRYTIMDDIKRFMRSSAGRLHGLICWNTTMRRILQLSRQSTQGDERIVDPRFSEDRKVTLGVKAFSNSFLIECIIAQFPKYRNALLSLVLSTDSSEIVAMRRKLRHALYDMSDHISQRLVLDERYTTFRLERVNYICEALELTVSRDTVAVLASEFFHAAESQSDTIVNLIEEVMNQAMSTTSDREEVEIFTSAGKQSMEAFANESAAAARGRANVVVVSVPNAIKVAKKKRTVPAEIAREAVLLEYVVDSRIDKVIEEVIVEIFTNGKLYPNPFPVVVNRFRAEAMRHELWRETDQVLKKFFLVSTKNRIKLVNTRNFLYKLTKQNVYGACTALQGCDGEIAQRMRRVLETCGVICPRMGPNQKQFEANQQQDTANTGLNKRLRFGAAYDVNICSSVGGCITLYSRIHRHLLRLGAEQGVKNQDTKSSTGESVPLSGTAFLTENPSTTLFETHVYEGPRLQGALELYADYIVSHALQVNDKTPNNCVLFLATGLFAIDLLNEDPGFDGGWYPAHRYHVYKAVHEQGPSSPTPEELSGAKPTRGGRRGSVQSSVKQPLSQSLNPSVALHEREFFEAVRERMHYPKYSNGEFLRVQKLRREKALCIQEVIRATKAKEPIIMHVAVLVEEDEEPFYMIVQKVIGFSFVQTPSAQVQNFSPPFLLYEPLFQSTWCDIDEATAAVEVICSGKSATEGRRVADDPSKPSSVYNKEYVESLKLRIAHSYSRGDMVLAYRALMRLSLLLGKSRLVPDLVRMLKRSSLALELDQLESANRVLRALLLENIRSEESRRKIKSKVLKDSFARYKRKVEDILARVDCVFLPGIRNAVHAMLLKVKSAITSERTGNNSLHIEVLEELSIYLDCIRTAAALSIHQNCPEIEKICRSYAEELLPVSETAFFK